MSLRALGAMLILMAGAAAAAGGTVEQRRRFRMAEALADGLDRLAAHIRFRRLPLPEALREAGRLPEYGAYFLRILETLPDSITLQNSWNQSFSRIEPPEVREILLHLTLDGDEERLLGNLTLARDRLRAYAVEARQQSTMRNRLFWTGALSAGGLLIILLL